MGFVLTVLVPLVPGYYFAAFTIDMLGHRVLQVSGAICPSLSHSTNLIFPCVYISLSLCLHFSLYLVVSVSPSLSLSRTHSLSLLLSHSLYSISLILSFYFSTSFPISLFLFLFLYFFLSSYFSISLCLHLSSHFSCSLPLSSCICLILSASIYPVDWICCNSLFLGSMCWFSRCPSESQ